LIIVSAAFANAVATGAVVVAKPKVKPWGQTVAYVRDLDGILIEICSPI
jgi:lactoylglutathione lyase